MKTTVDVICLDEPALYALIEQVVQQLRNSDQICEPKWLTDKQAMQVLNIKSKTTLQVLRDSGKIRFSAHSKKIILYDRDSIYEFIERNVRKTF